jgi:hypothetical protein
MKMNLQLPAKSTGQKRLDGKVFVLADSLDAYVTEKTANIFDVLIENGKISAKIFLDKESSEWPDDPTYLQFQEKAAKMKVVNDCAERGVSLIQQYNQTLMKDENQKQYLLRLVELHRKAYPTSSKAALSDKEKKIV